jgi:hypothetical protein
VTTVTIGPVTTFTIGPTTFTIGPVSTFTIGPVATEIIDPRTIIPVNTGIIVGTGGFTDRLGPVTIRIDDGILSTDRIGFVTEPGRLPLATGDLGSVTGTPLEGLDVRFFDVERGEGRPIADLDFLDAGQLGSLRGAGIDTVGAFMETGNDRLTEVLNASEVAVAELKVDALNAFRRDRPIDLDASRFDIERGLAEPVESVSGIGETRGAALREEGIGSVAELASARVEEVADVMGVSRGVANRMVLDAQRLMGR